VIGAECLLAGGFMEIIQIVGLGLIVTILSLIIKEQKPIFAFLLATFTGIVIFLFLIGRISSVIRILEELAAKSNINMVFLKTILKIIGVAYIAEFGAQIVRDAGQESVASKIELSGKILIMVMAIPIISVIIETVVKLLPA
jgi:stage III sporulation protein AD